MSSAETAGTGSEGARADAGAGRSKRPTLSITELELAFAQDPQSQAYVQLCEAYLEQGRFMEAMVVCKKGLKAHPGSVDARILLATVYAKQQKYPRAIQELDELIGANGTSAAAFLGRGKIRLASGDQKAAILDLKKAVDLDGGMSEATDLLKSIGVVYPEPVAPPPPPAPMAMAGPPMMAPQGFPSMVGRPPPPMMMPMSPSMDLPGGPAPGSKTGSLPPPLPRQPSSMGSGYGMPLPRPKLEGEDELEAIARQVADRAPEGSARSARLTLMMVPVLLVVVIGAVGYQFHKKRVTEGISQLSKSGRGEFLEDTYGSYKKSVHDFEKILDDFDSKHGMTLANLAHGYAILWGEHGESDRKPAMDKILTSATSRAPGSPHTIAALGLAKLYEGSDHVKAAQDAYDAIWPMVKKLREEQGQTGTWADLTLGIIDMELGNYSSAASTLSDVVQAQPQSIRAKIWYARAAQRAGHLDRAESAFTEALRVVKDHPAARAGRAIVRIQRGRLNSAAEDLVAFDGFVQQFPKEVSTKDAALAEYARSEVFRAAGEEGKATGAYEMAVRLDKTNADFPFGLGRTLLAVGKAKEALAPLSQALKMEPNRRAFLIALAQAETEVGSYSSAEQHISAALKQDPKDLAAAVAKARLLNGQRRPEAETYLKEVMEWSKGAPEISLELARMYRASSRTKEARDTLEKSINEIDSAPPTVKGQILLEYGKLMQEQGEDGTAYNAFKQAGEAGTMDGWFRVLQLLQRTGKRDKEALKAACERYLSAGSLPNTNEAQDICRGA